MRLGAHKRDSLAVEASFSVIIGRRVRAGALAATASSLALAVAAGLPAKAHAAGADAAPTSTAEPAEIVVNGVPYKETVLPTRLKSNSVYGLDLNVMDTPRSSTLLSTTQLETLNIDDPRAFSYLTASSYSDSSFGTPNIPRIRGQYADVFYNGMRYSFTQNGYGAPLNFDSIDNLSITKGPASVIDGPGPGVGGEVDILTKRPSLTHFKAMAEASIDTVSNRRAVIDIGGPIIPGELGVMVSYSGEHSGSYFNSHYMHKNALYTAVSWSPNDKYHLDFNAEVNVEQYTENVGVNRVNQALIDHGQYLQGAPSGELDSSLAFANLGNPIPVGLAAGTGNPYVAAPFLTEVTLTNAVKLDPKVTIDATPGVSSRAKLFNTQLIQTYDFNDHLTLENNTFFAYQDSDNFEPYYYADNSDGSYTIENRTDLKGDYNLFGVRNQYVVGGTFRFAHVNYISNFSAEAVSVFDLTGNPNLWRVLDAYQTFADAFPYKSTFGRTLYGVPGRDTVSAGNSGISDLYDGGLFFQDRMEFSTEFSVLFGGRIDAIWDHSHDQLGGAICANCFTSLPNGDPLPQDHATGTYGLGDANISVVYRPNSWVSGYITFDWTQSINPNGGEGGLNAYRQVPDSELMRANSYLYEAGLKFNLLNNKLFVSSAVFDQKRGLPTGPGGTQVDEANIRGVELELNYQPNRNLFATASYSYIDTTLNKAPGFYDYPAQVGVNVDGSATQAVFEPGQKYQDPGQPQHVFNFLGNYKFSNGLGLRTGMQVTGPIPLTASGYLDTAASATIFGTFSPEIAAQIAGVTNAKGYYKSPEIPWQYTWNAAVFYEVGQYTFTLSVYNLTDQKNWQPSPAFYGNDFLVRSDPRTVEFRLQAKF